MTMSFKDQEEIIHLAEQGYIISAIVRETGYSHTTCKRIVEDWGIDTSTLTEGRKNSVRQRKNLQRDESIREVYANTEVTMRELAKVHGVSFQRIQQICEGVVKKVVRPFRPVEKPGLLKRMFRAVGLNV